ncbi:MAG TPA: metalloregulator ArsR/SmtB family transcription factor [Vicinamibacterales bacterium]|nr:metalloregulator ArsR/SmtB family transcription factor [Vicinamibacterales bacterium]
MPRLRKTGAAPPAGSASVFAALGDDTRLRLLSRLCDDGPMSMAKLTAGFPMTRQGVSKHLKVMEQAGLVRRTLRGRESVWQLEAKRIADARRYLDLIAAQWDAALDRLKHFVETA